MQGGPTCTSAGKGAAQAWGVDGTSVSLCVRVELGSLAAAAVAQPLTTQLPGDVRRGTWRQKRLGLQAPVFSVIYLISLSLASLG